MLKWRKCAESWNGMRKWAKSWESLRKFAKSLESMQKNWENGLKVDKMC